MDVHRGSRYCLNKRIGGGSFGEIYTAINSITGEEVAVKIESLKIRVPQLINESRVYRALSGAVGIPNLKWYGRESDYNLLAMDLLGSSLEALFVESNRHFSLKTVLMIADQLISRIEYLHRRGIIHRDIKPDNFVVGRFSKSGTIYTIDFGLAKRYRDPKNLQHIPYVDGKTLVGTARYTSINTHLGIEQSRRDDLESIAYILIYFMKGSLPWVGLKAENREAKHAAICEVKVATPVNILCSGLPEEFSLFLGIVRRLEFSEEPAYAQYREFFKQLLIKEGFAYDSAFDWVKPQAVANAFPFSPASLPNHASLPTLAPADAAKRWVPSRPVRRIAPVVTPAVKSSQKAYRY
jgi:casein kinase I family protein HRR25